MTIMDTLSDDFFDEYDDCYDDEPMLYYVAFSHFLSIVHKKWQLHKHHIRDGIRYDHVGINRKYRNKLVDWCTYNNIFLENKWSLTSYKTEPISNLIPNPNKDGVLDWTAVIVCQKDNTVVDGMDRLQKCCPTAFVLVFVVA